MKKRRSLSEPKIDNFTRTHCKIGCQVAYRLPFALSSLIGNCVAIEGDYIHIDNGLMVYKKCHLGYVTVIFAEGVKNGGEIKEINL
jgi:hypothetical protein